MATTPGGLPYPLSSAPANQGANDIKALALELAARGSDYKSVRGKNALVFSGGRPTTQIAIPAGAFTTITGAVMNGWWVTGVPLILCVDTALLLPTRLALIAYAPPLPDTPGALASWFTGNLTVSWLAWGT